MRLQKADVSFAFFSTLTALATPRDITLQQLRIECFYPAYAVTEETARRLAAQDAHHGLKPTLLRAVLRAFRKVERSALRRSRVGCAAAHQPEPPCT
jgi:hypothetical protein